MAEVLSRCEHAEAFTIPKGEFAALIEGRCPDCDVATERTDDEFARCPCCRMELRIDGDMATARLRFVVVDEDGSPVVGGPAERPDEGGDER